VSPALPAAAPGERDSAARAIAKELSVLHQPGRGTAGVFRASWIGDVVIVVDDIEPTEAGRRLLAAAAGGGVDDCAAAGHAAFADLGTPALVFIVEQATGQRVASAAHSLHRETRLEVATLQLSRSPSGQRSR
jgi:hypothetical protein